MRKSFLSKTRRIGRVQNPKTDPKKIPYIIYKQLWGAGEDKTPGLNLIFCRYTVRETRERVLSRLSYFRVTVVYSYK